MKSSLTEAEITGRLQSAYQRGVIAVNDGNVDWLTEGKLLCAAVLIPLAWYREEWHVILTRRSETVETHSGQVSFPGGSCDGDESTAEATALREAEEEIGLKPGDVRLLGRLNDMVTITRFQVTPVVGIMPWPYPVHPAPGEVARVFTIPLAWLAAKENWREIDYKPDGTQRSFQVIVYDAYDGEVLWGISGRMIVNLLQVLGV